MWMRALAIAAVALLLAPAGNGIAPLFGGALVLVAVGASVWAFALGVLPRLRPRDRYDLGELQRVHEEEEIRALHGEGPLGLPENVVCPRCFTEYPARLGACPRCGAGG